MTNSVNFVDFYESDKHFNGQNLG